MLKKILLVLVVIVAGFAAFVATRPSEFSVTRSITVSAPPSAVFPLVNDFHGWSAWSPWEKLDPAMKKTFSGPAAGKGAGYAWTGNDKVGEGRMTILDSKPDESVAIKLEFIKPFEETSDTTFTFQPQGSATQVTWTMAGRSGFIAKAFGVFMDMDAMIGKDLEKGLATLKERAEAKKQASPRGADGN